MAGVHHIAELIGEELRRTGRSAAADQMAETYQFVMATRVDGEEVGA